MTQYRKKPVVIEAMQFIDTPPDGTNYDEIWEWAEKLSIAANTPIPDIGLVVFEKNDDVVIRVHTLEGNMEGQLKDWIIRGVQGEFYPCKPDIFEATYDPIET